MKGAKNAMANFPMSIQKSNPFLFRGSGRSKSNLSKNSPVIKIEEKLIIISNAITIYDSSEVFSFGKKKSSRVIKVSIPKLMDNNLYKKIDITYLTTLCKKTPIIKKIIVIQKNIKGSK